jgi:hypothetical protein
MRDLNRQATNARKEPSKKARIRDFALVRKGQVLGLFERAADAETAMRNIIPPDPPGTFEIVQMIAADLRRKADDVQTDGSGFDQRRPSRTSPDSETLQNSSIEMPPCWNKHNLRRNWPKF